jgi:hypothetical protein
MADEHVAYFWDREDADAVAEALGGEVRRERFHGEDDDEDHPWIVLLPTPTDPAALETLLHTHDGWLDSPTTEPPPPAPPPLPNQPRRLKHTPTT